jgi:hypothetical protein
MQSLRKLPGQLARWVLLHHGNARPHTVLGGKRFADDKEVETEVRKWLKQQSKDFYAAVSDALVKGWEKCVNVDIGYIEKQMSFPG